jgi:hypothetical protein
MMLREKRTAWEEVSFKISGEFQAGQARTKGSYPMRGRGEGA